MADYKPFVLSSEMLGHEGPVREDSLCSVMIPEHELSIVVYAAFHRKATPCVNQECSNTIELATIYSALGRVRGPMD